MKSPEFSQSPRGSGVEEGVGRPVSGGQDQLQTQPGMSREEGRLLGKWTYSSDPGKLPLVLRQPLGPRHSREQCM